MAALISKGAYLRGLSWVAARGGDLCTHPPESSKGTERPWWGSVPCAVQMVSTPSCSLKSISLKQLPVCGNRGQNAQPPGGEVAGASDCLASTSSQWPLPTQVVPYLLLCLFKIDCDFPKVRNQNLFKLNCSFSISLVVFKLSLWIIHLWDVCSLLEMSWASSRKEKPQWIICYLSGQEKGIFQVKYPESVPWLTISGVCLTIILN